MSPLSDEIYGNRLQRGILYENYGKGNSVLPSINNKLECSVFENNYKIINNNIRIC